MRNRRCFTTPTLLLAVVANVLLTASSASATLLKTDFLSPGNGLLVIDTATGLEWLSPVVTQGASYNSAAVLATSLGFRFASATEVFDLITDNFGPIPTTAFLGEVAGYGTAQNLFEAFGVLGVVACPAPTDVCRVTEGLTSTSSSVGTHESIGLLQYGILQTGQLLDSAIADDLSAFERGSWLVKSVPEPSSLVLVSAAWGLGSMVRGWRRLASRR